MLLTATAALISALISMCLRYPFAHYAVSQSGLLLFSQFVLPGAVFGAIISSVFALRGYLRHLWKAIVITAVFSMSYLGSVSAAVAIELSPVSQLILHKAGEVSWLSLFVGGLTGALCTLLAASLLLNSDLTLDERILKVRFWTPAGGFLGIAGWSLGPSLGMVLWQIVHSMSLTDPAETFQNAAHGETGHIYSLWAVWQVGIGSALALVVSRKRPTTNENCSEAAGLIKLLDK